MQDSRAFYEALVRDHAADLYRMAYRLTGRPEAAEDLTQETFVEAWRSIGSLREPDKARAWLFQILRHRYAHGARDASRRPRAGVSLDQVDSSMASAPDTAEEEASKRDELQLALNGLDGTFKEPFLMVFLEGLTCREAAEHLGVPLGTVLSRIHRARMALREALRRQDSRAG
jgi:RNA polymerase sigma-70 factor, ECF subfamily